MDDNRPVFVEEAPPPYPGNDCQQPNSYPPVSGYEQTTPTSQRQYPYAQQPYAQQQYAQQPYAEQPYAQQPCPQQQYAQQPYALHGQQLPYSSQTSQPTVIIHQPEYSLNVMAPSNHALLAWFTCLFCFWPCGIAAVIKSKEVDSAVRCGNRRKAAQASGLSCHFSILACIFGFMMYILVIIFVVTKLGILKNKF